MKTKLPTTWTRKFAWLPVITTHGARDIGHRIWFRTIYYRWSGQQIEYITVRDRQYLDEMLFEIQINPGRFGVDPKREEY